jgi:transposase InsO family protein
MSLMTSTAKGWGLNVDLSIRRENDPLDRFLTLLIPAKRVIRSFNRIIEWRGKPGVIRVDIEGSFSPKMGREYISETMRKWAETHNVTIQHIQPSQPQQNAYVERYNRTVRHEWLANTSSKASSRPRIRL